MAKEDAIGMGPNGEIEQYKKGDPIPPTTYKVIDDDGTVTEQALDDDENDPFLESDDDLELDDDED